MLKTFLNWLGLGWLLEPTLSFICVAGVVFVSALVVLTVFGLLDSRKKEVPLLIKFLNVGRLSPPAIRSVYITLLAIFLLSLIASFGGKGGGIGEGVGPSDQPGSGGIQTPGTVGPETRYVELKWNNDLNTGDVSITFPEVDDGNASNAKTISGDVSNLSEFYAGFENELKKLRDSHLTKHDHFVFDLDGCGSAQMPENIRKRLESIFTDRFSDLDVVYEIR